MEITYKTVHKITFPVFVLPSGDWFYEDGMLFLGDRVLDDTKMPAKGLGTRRLQCGRTDLVPLKKAILTYVDLLHSNKKHFIDCTGKPFTYKKTLFVKVITHRIKRIEKKNTASLLWLYGVNIPFTIPRPPINDPAFAQIAYLGGTPWLHYSYSTDMQETKNRQV